MTFRYSPYSAIALVRFFFIDIIFIPPKLSVVDSYRVPSTFSISPTDCMDLVRFFMVFFIIYFLQMSGKIQN